MDVLRAFSYLYRLLKFQNPEKFEMERWRIGPFLRTCVQFLLQPKTHACRGWLRCLNSFTFYRIGSTLLIRRIRNSAFGSYRKAHACNKHAPPTCCHKTQAIYEAADRCRLLLAARTAYGAQPRHFLRIKPLKCWSRHIMSAVLLSFQRFSKNYFFCCSSSVSMPMRISSNVA